MVNLLMLICAGASATAIAWSTNWLALIPWRRAKDLHWTERARLFYPVRAAAANNLWVLPGLLTAGVILAWPDCHPHWCLLLLVTGIGVVAGTIPLDHEVFPRVPFRALLRQVAIAWVMRFLLWSVFLAAISMMPEQFCIESFAIPAAVLGLCLFWTHDGWIRIGRWLGLFASAPEGLQRLVTETASRMNIPVGEVCLMRTYLGQAYALPASRRLLFSERLVELLNESEIKAVCAHELAHLSESRSQHYSRYIIWLTFLPWLLFKPVVNTMGMAGLLVLLFATTTAPLAYRILSHKLEMRADQIALAHELDPGTYARALAKLYEDGLLPAVNAKKRASHPHLYDRLMAAGVTPDFPRPAAPASLAWHGHIFAVALGFISVFLVGRMVRF